MSGHGWADDDDDGKGDTKAKKFVEFDCPGCNANNPWGDGFEDGEEINCHYCGSSFIAQVSDEGKLKLKEI
jgi:DNA-directed RNA polymerase subunit RPC12/RpoP